MDVSAIDNTVNDVSFNGTDSPWIGTQAEKFYLQSGQFSVTLKTSRTTSVNTESTGIEHNDTDARLGVAAPVVVPGRRRHIFHR